MRYALASTVMGFALAGCGSSSPPANSASYTLIATGRLSAEVYVSFDGPPAAARSVMRAFEAVHKGDYAVASDPVGQTQCDISAHGGKVTISVVTVVGLDASVGQKLCNSVRRF